MVRNRAAPIRTCRHPDDRTGVGGSGQHGCRPPATSSADESRRTWSIKGIDPRTRDAARQAARRAGMSVAEWLDHVIREGALPADAPDESDRDGSLDGIAARLDRLSRQSSEAASVQPARATLDRDELSALVAGCRFAPVAAAAAERPPMRSTPSRGGWRRPISASRGPSAAPASNLSARPRWSRMPCAPCPRGCPTSNARRRRPWQHLPRAAMLRPRRRSSVRSCRAIRYLPRSSTFARVSARSRCGFSAADNPQPRHTRRRRRVRARHFTISRTNCAH